MVPEFKGRFLGIIVLVAVHFIIGFIHVIFGFALLSGSFSVSVLSVTTLVYSIYTSAYGLLTLLFTFLVWTGKRLGWIGTTAVSSFVIIADSLTMLGLLTVLGIPKFAAVGEIPVSIIILGYLFQPHVRAKYAI
ncbi:hypothetical protein JW988_08435 [Candidatus Bathyarchaeota archaeon]|nr:hypothetical protein [Candidatus Bathyarchaeota archaeon]